MPVATLRLDPRDFLFAKHVDATLFKLPGMVSGNGFAVEDCENCDVLLLDYSAQITVDVVNRSRVFVGPVDGSVFIRECYNSIFLVVCRQFRMRDCENCTVFLYCATQPVIESSRKLKFACFRGHYSLLSEHLRISNLDMATNQWSNIHDFGSPPSPSAELSDTDSDELFLPNLQNYTLLNDMEATAVLLSDQGKFKVPLDVVESTGWHTDVTTTVVANN